MKTIFIYSCYLLTPDSVKTLKSWLEVNSKKVKENVFLHHCTIEFMHKTLTNYTVGEYAEINVIGYTEDENASAFIVDTCLSKNENPHITISTAKGIAPVYSNKMIKQSYVEYFEPISIVCRIEEYVKV